MSSKKIKINDVARLINGHSFKPEDRTEKGLKIIRIQNLNNSLARYNRTEKIVADKYKIKKGDILIAWSASLGVYEWEQEEDALLNQHIFKVEFVSDQILKSYFKYIVELAFDELTYKMRGVGLKHLTKKQLDEYEFNLPELEEQQQIVRVLNEIEGLIKMRKTSIGLLDEHIKAVFLQMFGNPIENPKGWKKEPIKKYTRSIVPGRNKPKSFTGNIPWIRTEKLQDLNYIDEEKEYLISVFEMEASKNKIIPKDSVVMASTGNIGIVSLTDKDIVINQQLHAYVCNEGIIGEFLMFVLFFQRPVIIDMSEKAIIKYLNKTKCQNIPIIIPPLSDQKTFASNYELNLNQKRHYQRSLFLLEELFQSLLYRSFGKEKEEIEEDAIDFMMNDEFTIQKFFDDVKKGNEFETLKQYDIHQETLFNILERTKQKNKENQIFKKGIVQFLDKKGEIKLSTNREYQLKKE